MEVTTASPATTSNAPSGTGDIVGQQDDDLAMFDMDPGEFKAAAEPTAANNGAAAAAELDGISESMELGHSPGSPTEQPTKDDSNPTSAESDAQPDQLTSLRQQAQQFGYSAEDVQSLDAETIRQLVEAQQSLVLQAGAAAQSQQFQPNPWQQGVPQYPQAPQPQPYYGQPQPGAPQAPQVNVQFDESQFDPAFIGKMGEMQQQFNQHLQNLNQQNLAVQQHLQMQAQNFAIAQQRMRDQAESRELEAWVSKKGEAFRPLLGGETLSANSPQIRLRQQLFTETRRLAQQAAAVGVSLDADSLREQAAKNVLGSKYDYFQQQAQRQPLQQRQKQMVGRANGIAPRTPGKSGRDAAADRSEAFFRERGLLG